MFIMLYNRKWKHRDITQQPLWFVSSTLHKHMLTQTLLHTSYGGWKFPEKRTHSQPCTDITSIKGYFRAESLNPRRLNLTIVVTSSIATTPSCILKPKSKKKNSERTVLRNPSSSYNAVTLFSYSAWVLDTSQWENQYYQQTMWYQCILQSATKRTWTEMHEGLVQRLGVSGVLPGW